MKRNFLLLAVMMFALSPVLSAQEPTVRSLFNGTNLDGWNFKAGDRVNTWTVGRLASNTVEEAATTMEPLPLRGGPGAGTRGGGAGAPAGAGLGASGVMINATGNDWRDARRGVDIYTTERFGDVTVRLEFLVLRRGNSGVYMMGEYELQIADSFGRPSDRMGPGDMGGIWATAAPRVNAAGAPGTWQSLEIEFVAPRFDAEGNKTANAIFKRVVLNGILIQENVEVQGSTGGGLTGREHATGPIMFQGDHGPVAFRNIEVIVP